MLALVSNPDACAAADLPNEGARGSRRLEIDSRNTANVNKSLVAVRQIIESLLANGMNNAMVKHGGRHARSTARQS